MKIINLYYTFYQEKNPRDIYMNNFSYSEDIGTTQQEQGTYDDCTEVQT